MTRYLVAFSVGCLAFVASVGAAEDVWKSGEFSWRASRPLVAPAERPEDPCHAIKDPTVVFHDGRWHLFCTIRSQKRTHQIEYLSFANWDDANEAPRHVLQVTDGYYCAPQVFYFTPHRRWYLIYQTADESRKPALQPAFSTTEDLTDPASWSKPKLLYQEPAEGVSQWIDFWVICDAAKAHLFFTSLDGRMWRAETALADFPHGWTTPQVVLQADIFEASHIYRLKGQNHYVALVEAQTGGRGWRYYQAFLADRLDGEWRPLAAMRDNPFAGLENVTQSDPPWTDSISHGEFLRAGYDERLEVDPKNLRFLFQGVTNEARAGKSYGEIPWRLGLLEPTPQ
jgi:hypothetical protein